MDNQCEIRRWDELIPDVLGQIFGNLSLEEILTVVPRVCKSWGRTVMGPYCWKEIDIEEWSQCREPQERDQMVRLLVNRSCGSLRKMCVFGISNDETLSFIANHSKSLQSLCVPRSGISNSIVVEVAERLCNVTFLDVSYCMDIGARALEAIGKHCKFLSDLKRIMHPMDVFDKKDSQDDEALAIAYTMPKLKRLEISYLVIDTKSVVEILKNCPRLELLDVRGCWHVDMDDSFLKKFPKLKVLGPHIVDSDYFNGLESCSDISSYSGYLAWDFVVGDDDDDDVFDEMSDGNWEEEDRIEDLQVRFYEDGEEIHGGVWGDWNQSP